MRGTTAKVKRLGWGLAAFWFMIAGLYFVLTLAANRTPAPISTIADFALDQIPPL